VHSGEREAQMDGENMQGHGQVDGGERGTGKGREDGGEGPSGLNPSSQEAHTLHTHLQVERTAQECSGSLDAGGEGETRSGDGGGIGAHSVAVPACEEQGIGRASQVGGGSVVAENVAEDVGEASGGQELGIHSGSLAHAACCSGGAQPRAQMTPITPTTRMTPGLRQEAEGGQDVTDVSQDVTRYVDASSSLTPSPGPLCGVEACEHESLDGKLAGQRHVGHGGGRDVRIGGRDVHVGGREESRDAQGPRGRGFSLVPRASSFADYEACLECAGRESRQAAKAREMRARVSCALRANLGMASDVSEVSAHVSAETSAEWGCGARVLVPRTSSFSDFDAARGLEEGWQEGEEGAECGGGKEDAAGRARGRGGSREGLGQGVEEDVGQGVGEDVLQGVVHAGARRRTNVRAPNVRTGAAAWRQSVATEERAGAEHARHGGQNWARGGGHMLARGGRALAHLVQGLSRVVVPRGAGSGALRRSKRAPQAGGAAAADKEATPSTDVADTRGADAGAARVAVLRDGVRAGVESGDDRADLADLVRAPSVAEHHGHANTAHPPAIASPALAAESADAGKTAGDGGIVRAGKEGKEQDVGDASAGQDSAAAATAAPIAVTSSASAVSQPSLPAQGAGTETSHGLAGVVGGQEVGGQERLGARGDMELAGLAAGGMPPRSRQESGRCMSASLPRSVPPPLHSSAGVSPCGSLAECDSLWEISSGGEGGWEERTGGWEGVEGLREDVEGLREVRGLSPARFSNLKKVSPRAMPVRSRILYVCTSVSLYRSMYRSTYLPTYLPIYLSIYLPIYQRIYAYMRVGT